METKRYGFYTDGSVQEDKEVYPGQYDPIDLSEIEFSFDLGVASELCVLHLPGRKRLSIIRDLSGDEDNLCAAAFLKDVMPDVRRITGGQITWPLRGDIVVVQTIKH